eukprot:TRINITY_DN1797_c0_g1_i3.p1 TRINITY_DN1797_c0_g1~~TRINITY_DN1797_c0_g1_i3.p1  ORF type:complete len:111 (-),score=16.75 TRINITY_DN1797_c0_g1_i3:100-432(-)
MENNYLSQNERTRAAMAAFQSHKVKLLWSALFFEASVLAIILRDYAGGLSTILSVLKECESEECAGKVAVFRISFALTFFFITFAIFSLKCIPEGVRHYANSQGWWWKQL